MEQSTGAQATQDTAEFRVIYFDNHLPIRIKGEWEEVWLSYDYLDFGGNYIRAYRNRKGEYLIWHRHNPAYTTERAVSTFIGKFRSGEGDIMDRFPLCNAENWGSGVENSLSFSDTERGKIQVFLEKLGLSKVEEF